MLKLTFNHMLQLAGYDSTGLRLVRHSNKDFTKDNPALQSFKYDKERFESYQSFQSSFKFGDAKAIASFAPGPRSTAVFLGIWDILRQVESKDFTADTHAQITKHKFPESWHNSPHVWYELAQNSVLEEFSGRIIINWGGSAVVWVQQNTDKEIIEIKMKNSIEDFQSYDGVQLSFEDIKLLAKNPHSNSTWVNALSTVRGVYLIRDSKSKKLYVGSAYGDKGIFGRWSDYAKNGDGGNIALKGLDPVYFEFSILEIASGTMSPQEIIDRENRWKLRLGTRDGGLNEPESGNRQSFANQLSDEA